MIIGFSGKKQSGKNTLATTLQEYLEVYFPNLTVKQYSFADLLKKNICMDILGLTHEQCYGTDEQKNTLTDVVWHYKQLTAREVMQVVGTDIFRSLQPNVWANALVRQIRRDNCDFALVTDCRFPNEVETIQNANGIVVRLMRDVRQDTHPSENALNEDVFDWSHFDVVIDNRNLTEREQFIVLIGYLKNTNAIP